MDIAGTPGQALVYLNTHWGTRYSFALPETPSGNWAATAKFGDHDRLQAPSPPTSWKQSTTTTAPTPAPPTNPNLVVTAWAISPGLAATVWPCSRLPAAGK